MHVDLGQQLFGSTEQARALLNLFEQHPDETEISISFQTDTDRTFLVADLDAGTLKRLRQGTNSPGTSELWKRHVMARLRHAAGGGTLNETPEGNIPGTIERLSGRV